MKRFISLLLCILLVGASFGYVIAEDKPSPVLVASAETMSDEEFRRVYADEFVFNGETSPNTLYGTSDHGYYYAQLNKYEKVYYEAFEYMLINDLFTYLFMVPEKASSIDEVIYAIQPLYIESATLNRAYHASLYDYPAKADKLRGGTKCQLLYAPNGEQFDVYIQIDMELHPEYEESFTRTRDEFIDDVTDGAADKISAYSKLKYVHDAIVAKGEYDYDNVANIDADSRAYLMDHSAFGISVEGNGVCESYAKLYKEILDKMGYTSVLAISTVHMWNVVKIGNSWYIVDCTFDDTAEINEYFLSPKTDDMHEDDSFLSQPYISDEYYTDGNSISVVSLSTETAYAGDKIREFTVSSGVRTLSSKWTDDSTGDVLSADDKYERGVTYTYEATLKAEEGMDFVDGIEVHSEGIVFSDITVGTSVDSDGKTLLNVAGKVRILEEIKKLTYNLRAVVPGKEAPMIAVTEDDPVEETLQMWMLVLGEGEYAVAETLELGGLYAYALSFTAKDGYTFTENTEFVISGIEWDESEYVVMPSEDDGEMHLIFAGYHTVKEHIHTEQTVPGKATSCTEDGLTDGKVCETCGEVLKEQNVIPGGHTLTVNVEGNIKSTSCTKCDYEESHELNEKELAFFGSGDLNYDGIINSSDLSDLLSAYGTTNKNADMNSDGLVNSSDLSELLSNYGKAL